MKSMNVQVRGLMVMQPGMSPVSTPQHRLEVIPEGIRGDSHAGLTRLSKGEQVPNTRQVSIVSVEELARVAQALGIPEIEAEWIGANILLEGLPELSATPKGSRLHFPGGAVLTVEQANTPCSSAGRSIQTHFPERRDLPAAFPKAAAGRRGLLAWVQQNGVISLGDAVRIELPD
jgi:MOSC domain-containing protein YiiM